MLSRRIAALFVFYVLAALWFSRPLLQHMTEALPFGTTPEVAYGETAGQLKVRPADMHQVLFHQWLFFDNLVHGRNPFANVYEFGPLNTAKLHWLGVWGFPMQLLFFPLAFVSPVLALNVMLLATFPITGLVHYALLRTCAVRPSFAFLGSALFTFALARRVQMFCGHMNGALYFLLSLSALLYVRAWLRRSWGYALAAGASILLWALGEWHMYYFSALFLPFLGLALLDAELGRARRKWLSLRQLVWKSLPVLAGLALGGAYLLWYRSRVIVGTTAEHRSWGEMAGHSPSPIHLLADDRHIHNPVMFGADVESAIALGVSNLIVLGLVVCGDLGLSWLAARRGLARAAAPQATVQRLQAALLRYLLPAGAVFALLTTGAKGDSVVPLYSFLYRVLPHFNIVRVPGRMIYIVYFCVAVCLPLALERVYRRSLQLQPASQRWLGPCAAALVFGLVAAASVDAPGVQLSAVLDPRAFAPLRERIPAAEPLLLLPVFAADASSGSLAEHFIVATQRPTLNGYAPNAPLAAAKTLAALRALNRGKLPKSLHEQLWQLGVRHVVRLSHVSFLRAPGGRPDYVKRLLRAHKIERVERTQAYQLFALRPP